MAFWEVPTLKPPLGSSIKYTKHQISETPVIETILSVLNYIRHWNISKFNYSSSVKFIEKSINNMPRQIATVVFLASGRKCVRRRREKKKKKKKKLRVL